LTKRVDILDKVEYKIRADEIKALIGEGRYAEAVRIADTIDWKRVKSVAMLCTISDLYKINRRYEESRDILLMAYDRHPTGRAIVYSLCELAIKMGEFVQAVEYYKEFVRIAPRDTGRYILQYKLYEAQEVSLEERIAVLEEFKKHDYRERWAYELAYLYHRVGLTTECIEECDEMFLWFGEGRYVMKALELKALHEPLSPEQQDRYARYKASLTGQVDMAIVSEKDEVGKDETGTIEIKQPTKEMPPVTDEVIQAYNAGEYREEQQEVPEEQPYQGEIVTPQAEPQEEAQTEPEYDPYQIRYPHINEIKEPSVDISDYNTMNLQETLAQGLKEAFAQEEVTDDTKVYVPGQEQPSLKPDTAEIYDERETSAFSPVSAAVSENPTGAIQEVFFDTMTQDIPSVPEMGIDIKYGGNGPILGQEKGAEEAPLQEEPAEEPQPDFSELSKDKTVKFGAFVEEYKDNAPAGQTVQTAFGQQVYEEKPLEEEVPGAVIHPNASYQMPSHFERILAQESDGQISLAVEPEPMVEKQITGQISISEYMENWEQFKKSQQQKQLERVKKRVAEETGDMFADFDEKTKAGLQEKIEKAISDAIKKERHEKASGRGDWSRRNEDVINDAVADVMDSENMQDADDCLEYISGEEELPPETDIEETEEQAEAPVQEKEDTQEPSDEVTEAEETAGEDAEEAEEVAEDEKEAEAEPDTSEEEPAEEKATEDSEASDESDEDEDEDAEDAEESEASDDKDSKKDFKSKDKKDNKDNKDSKDNKKDGKKHHIGNREMEERVRTMTPEEKELFGPYIHHKKSRRQIINAIDNLSMDAYSGNAIVTGEEGAGTVNLAKGLIKAVQQSDSNFSGKVAKITANTLNKKSAASIFDKLANGALIIQRAADLLPETVNELLKVLQEENKGLIIVMEDTREDMDRFLDKNPSLKQSFNVRVDIEALDNDSLVAYAKQYALEREYAIDNLGILALHTRISDRQTLDHEVTVAEVKDIVDDAIYYAEKKSVGHFVDLIVNKRYDENDMVILREKDFLH
jgi:tetratricopeptide (TPR) repeat protein